MPNPHATFATSIRFDPPIGDRRPDEVIRAPGGLTLVLDDTTRVRIDPDDRRSSGFVSVLEDLARRRRPAYVEVNPDTGTIALLLIPRPAWVIGVSAGAENTLEVELHPSHARHFLRMSEENSDVLERRLRDALEAKRPVLLTEGHRDRKPHAPGVDVLHDLIVGKAGCPPVRIVQGDEGVLAVGQLDDPIDQAPKVVTRDQAASVGPQRRWVIGLSAHGPAFPWITLMLRNRACAAAWVIQPDWPGWPLPHVMKPKRRR